MWGHSWLLPSRFPAQEGLQGMLSLLCMVPLPRYSQMDFPGRSELGGALQKSCSARRELWYETGAEDHFPETSPGSVSSRCKYPLDLQPLGCVQCVLSR